MKRRDIPIPNPNAVPPRPYNSIIETFDDPDFIEPESGPLQGVLVMSEHGHITDVRPLTAEEQAEDEAERASRPARIAALAARRALAAEKKKKK